jgi:hypothetical protein
LRPSAADEPPPTSATPEEATAKALAVIGPRPWNQRACDVLIRKYGGTAPGARVTKALRPLVAKAGEDAVLAAFARYVDETEAEFFSPERFATTFGRWAPRSPPSQSAPKDAAAAWLTAARTTPQQLAEEFSAWCRENEADPGVGSVRDRWRKVKGVPFECAPLIDAALKRAKVPEDRLAALRQQAEGSKA